jgi:hypothetical protein
VLASLGPNIDLKLAKTRLPMMQLCWELAGTLLLGSEASVSDSTLHYPEICLGRATQPGYWRFGDHFSLMYSLEDWQAVDVILSCRGWRLKRERDADGLQAYVEEVQA